MPQLTLADLTLDPDRRELSYGGRRVHLGSKVAGILQVLLAASWQVVSQDSLLAKVYGERSPKATLRSDILRARLALEELHAPLEIVTTYGEGYQLLEKHRDSSLLSISPQEVQVFRRVLDIASRTRPDLTRTFSRFMEGG